MTRCLQLHLAAPWIPAPIFIIWHSFNHSLTCSLAFSSLLCTCLVSKHLDVTVNSINRENLSVLYQYFPWHFCFRMRAALRVLLLQFLPCASVCASYNRQTWWPDRNLKERRVACNSTAFYPQRVTKRLKKLISNVLVAAVVIISSSSSTNWPDCEHEMYFLLNNDTNCIYFMRRKEKPLAFVHTFFMQRCQLESPIEWHLTKQNLVRLFALMTSECTDRVGKIPACNEHVKWHIQLGKWGLSLHLMYICTTGFLKH